MGGQKGELSCSLRLAEPYRKRKGSSSFLIRTQPMKRLRLCGPYPPNSLVPSIKQFSSSPALALQGLAGWAHPGGQPQVAILC